MIRFQGLLIIFILYLLKGIVSKRQPVVIKISKEEDWQEVNIDSVRDDESRKIGADY